MVEDMLKKGLYVKERYIRSMMLDNLNMSRDESRRLSSLLLNRSNFAIIAPVKPDALLTMKRLCGPNGRFLLRVLLARYYEDAPDQSTGDE